MKAKWILALATSCLSLSDRSFAVPRDESSLIVVTYPAALHTQTQQTQLSRSVSAALAACRDVAIIFGPGLYLGVRLVVDVRSQTGGCTSSLTLLPESPGESVFEGNQEPQFLAVMTDKARLFGRMTGLLLRDYINGVSLNGKNDAPTDGAFNFEVHNNRFENIGSRSLDKKAKVKGWGAIVIRGIGGVTISGNSFDGLRNAFEPELLHAVYLDESSDNVIDSNIFGEMDSAIIKLRSGANRNKITNNEFYYRKHALVQDWFCNAAIRKHEACPVEECPSYDNQISNNVIRLVETNALEDTVPISSSNPFVSYKTIRGVRVFESYYDKMPPPSKCIIGGQRAIGIEQNELRLRSDLPPKFAPAAR